MKRAALPVQVTKLDVGWAFTILKVDGRVGFKN
jgi:hypothetical protein